MRHELDHVATAVSNLIKGIDGCTGRSRWDDSLDTSGGEPVVSTIRLIGFVGRQFSTNRSTVRTTGEVSHYSPPSIAGQLASSPFENTTAKLPAPQFHVRGGT
ncbi:hypothetical protein CHELA20_10992 [Hyphomicrobiales bacterium]|nr:hypothetical protein CHELA20_10992 [Hyphomicrobiales bacterium]CAH1694538.1 hypothetical protein CHELA41_51223 [Hyphomicrobiales bacterium]